MLGVLFDFRGSVGRVRYLAGLSGAFLGLLAICVAASFLIALALRPLAAPLLAILVAGLALVYLWAVLALGSKRLRDAGFEPWVVLPAMAVVGVADYLFARAHPEWLIFPDSPDTLVGTVAGLVVLAVMLLYPARREGEGDSPVLRGVALLAVALAAGLALFLAVPADVMSSPSLPKPIRKVYVASLLVRGNQAFERKRYDEALGDYQRAMDLSPTFSMPYVNRGLVRQAKGDLAGAAADFDRAIALDPNSLNGHINRARLWAQTGNPQSAIAEMDKAVAIAPGKADPLHRRALLRGGVGQWTGALADIERAAALEPKNRAILADREIIRRAAR